MKKIKESGKDKVWTMIAREKKIDSINKLISIVAWTITLLVVSTYFIFTVIDFSKALKLYHSGAVPSKYVSESIIPFLIVLGGLSFLVAILTTVRMFLRLRTSSLLEIQQRLANLEEIITTEQP